MGARRGLIILDRDGVLNAMLGVRGTPSHDSPMNAAQVTVFPWVASVLKALTDAGYGLAIATNQPAAAKGKTTRDALEGAHALILAESQREGGRILSSHICWHRSEDGCPCRKPKTKLLEDALAQHAEFDRAESFMVGDRGTDILAGAAAGLKTALLTDEALETVLPDAFVRPTFHGVDLRDFQRWLLGT